MMSGTKNQRPMLCNPQRGEVVVHIGGHRVSMCLTLGALAALEQWCGGDLGPMFKRFEAGQAQFNDTLNVLRAGVLGARQRPEMTSDEPEFDPEQQLVADALPDALSAVRELLQASFEPDTGAENPLRMNTEPDKAMTHNRETGQAI